MHLQQRPHLAAQLAAAARLLRARHRVLEQVLHLGAVGRAAVGQLARSRVHQQLHRSLNLRLAVPPVLLRHTARGAAVPLPRAHQRVLVAHRDLALLADVEVGARLAAPTLPGLELALAHVARRNKRGLARVVEVIQHHHRGVLRPAQRVELEVITLAQRQKRLSRVEKLRVHLLAVVPSLSRERLHPLAHQVATFGQNLVVRRQRRLHVVALLTELKHGALIGRRRVVPAVIVGDALAALRALMREVRHDEIVSHVLNRDAQFLGELRVEVVANLRVRQLLPARLALRRRFLTLVLLGVLRLFLFDPRDPILGDAGEVIAVKVRQLGGGGDVVVLVPEVKLVVQVTQRQHDAFFLRLPEHLEVPLPQLVALGRLLLLGVAVEDVVLTLERGTRPDEARREPALLDVLQVADENLVVAVGAKRAALARRHLDPRRPKVLDGIEVGEVHAPGVGRGTLAAVLLDVDAQQTDVDALNLLEK